eukprot:CAMPEP_0119021720 /NCGR_PEP_ID=MMETSP1176-20130426/26565_1 /TAXON_ID=265551 /ORGANISM="Synedropsis recta cf, Strain CCMP1620" /LENGTH=91 /DNA_ID=CAMNT_0006976401 /DNA_START=36 /DNA_END=308 /DNA_ORIENTATION=+
MRWLILIALLASWGCSTTEASLRASRHLSDLFDSDPPPNEVPDGTEIISPDDGISPVASPVEPPAEEPADKPKEEEQPAPTEPPAPDPPAP